jgi:hypothetical protein
MQRAVFLLHSVGRRFDPSRDRLFCGTASIGRFAFLAGLRFSRDLVPFDINLLVIERQCIIPFRDLSLYQLPIFYVSLFYPDDLLGVDKFCLSLIPLFKTLYHHSYPHLYHLPSPFS